MVVSTFTIKNCNQARLFTKGRQVDKRFHFHGQTIDMVYSRDSIHFSIVQTQNGLVPQKCAYPVHFITRQVRELLVCRTETKQRQINSTQNSIIQFKRGRSGQGKVLCVSKIISATVAYLCMSHRV